jgi:hypothetical protein
MGQKERKLKKLASIATQTKSEMETTMETTSTLFGALISAATITFSLLYPKIGRPSLIIISIVTLLCGLLGVFSSLFVLAVMKEMLTLYFTQSLSAVGLGLLGLSIYAATKAPPKTH